MQSKKLVLIGDKSVGKTAILQRYINGKFEESMATLCGGFKNKEVIFEDETGKKGQMKL